MKILLPAGDFRRAGAQLSEEVKKGLRKEGVDITYFPPGKNGPATSSN